MRIFSIFAKDIICDNCLLQYQPLRTRDGNLIVYSGRTYCKSCSKYETYEKERTYKTNAIEIKYYDRHTKICDILQLTVMR